MTPWAARSTRTAKPRSRPSAPRTCAPSALQRAMRWSTAPGAVETPSIWRHPAEHGALTAQMTGSGAAVFGVFDDETAARNALAALRPSYKQCYLRRPTHGGPRVTVRRQMFEKK